MPADTQPTLLALDTATRQATAAVSRGETILAAAGREVTTHSEGLLALIQQVMGEAGVAAGALDGVVCGRGPGSFTGLRIGLATAKGICFAGGIPLVCVSSLVALGRGGGRWLESQGQERDGLVAAVLDARRKEVFCGLFRAGVAVDQEQVLSPEAAGRYLGELGESALLCGDGAVLYREQLPGALAPDGLHTIRAEELALAGLGRVLAGEADELHEAVPQYIRASDAKLPKVPQVRGPS